MSGSDAGTSSTQAVLAALDALYKNPDNKAKAEANTWLQSFQKTPEAWQTANGLLLSQTLPVEPRLFAAQTFRIKSTYDVDQIPRETLPSLRATLLTALQAYKQGPRVIRTQICLALAGLALQLRDGEDPEWGDNVVGWMIKHFGSDPEDVLLLLEFLTVLPEEITTNQRIPVDTVQYTIRSATLLQDPALDVLQLLSMYVQATGVTEEIQSAVFACLASWLKAGEINVQALISLPLFSTSFDSLAKEQVFDVAVDVICDIINETQEVDDNREAIELIVGRILPFKSDLQQAISDGDDDKVRGLCRIFAQAGETYHRLMIQHRDAFFPLVEAIFECVRYTDLDIVQITFRFWYVLATDIGRTRGADPTIVATYGPVFEQVLEAIVKHLRFPADMEAWSGQERDDFKSFRHYMGDTLKDCCHVLGSQKCLARSLTMIQDCLSGHIGGQVQWQDVEAPLFSMRAMGAEADPHDNEVLPRIIDVIPQLPGHVRLNYAALLVISRYTEWVKYHPDRIPMILSYISAGFSAGDAEVAAAAAQALTYLCQDCDRELAPFVPQLYAFYQAVVDTIDPDDGRSIAKAIGYVIAAMPAEQMVGPLTQFTQPLLQHLAQLAASDSASKVELQRAADRMEQLEQFIEIVSKRMDSSTLSPSCTQTCAQSYQVIDSILSRYGNTFFVAERACELLRRGMRFFDHLAIEVLPAMLDRMSTLFEQSGYSSFIWIVGKAIDLFGERVQRPDHIEAVRQAFQRISNKVLSTLQSKSPADIPDLMDDYIHTCTAMAQTRPGDLVGSAVFGHTVRVAVSVLEHTYQPPIVDAAMDYMRSIVDPEVLSNVTQDERQRLDNVIDGTIHEQGASIVQTTVRGMVTGFDVETLPNVLVLLRLIALRTLRQSSTYEAWMTQALAGLSDQVISPADKQKCLNGVQMAMGNANVDGLKQSLQGLYGASRKSRERARMERQTSSMLAGGER
jgi:transportin-3